MAHRPRTTETLSAWCTVCQGHGNRLQHHVANRFHGSVAPRPCGPMDGQFERAWSEWQPVVVCRLSRRRCRRLRWWRSIVGRCPTVFICLASVRFPHLCVAANFNFRRSLVFGNVLFYAIVVTKFIVWCVEQNKVQIRAFLALVQMFLQHFVKVYLDRQTLWNMHWFWV